MEIAVSKFKATCLAVIEEVRRTGVPVRITRFGKPVAEIVPIRARPGKFPFGCMKDEMEICGDIVGPIGAFDDWKGEER